MIHNDPPIVSETPLQSNLITLVARSDSKIKQKTNHIFVKNRNKAVSTFVKVLAPKPINGAEVLKRLGKKIKAKDGYPEDVLQVAVANHLDALQQTNAFRWHHTPNGGLRAAKEAAKFKRMGVKPGVADICIRAKGQTIWIELKSATGVLSDDQKTFRDECVDLGHPYHVVKGRLPQDVNQQVSAILRDNGVLV